MKLMKCLFHGFASICGLVASIVWINRSVSSIAIASAFCAGVSSLAFIESIGDYFDQETMRLRDQLGGRS